MNTNNRILKLSFSLAVLLASQASLAGGTPANTEVSNTATLTYSVNNIAQNPIDSAAAKFLVDKKIDLLVSGTSGGTGSNGDVLVTPESTINALTYTLKNEGNFEQEFTVLPAHLPATVDKFDAASCTYTVTPATSTPVGSTSVGTSSVVTLAIDETATVAVNCEIQDLDVVTDGDRSIIEVVATATDGSGNAMQESGQDTVNVDVVLADGVGSDGDLNGVANSAGGLTAGSAPVNGVRNAMHAAVQAYQVEVPVLSVGKASTLISDPFNGTTAPKRIPGAVIEYTITVENTGSIAAADVTITDPLPAEFDHTVSMVTDFSLSPAAVPASSSVSSFDGTNVVVTGIDVPAGGTVVFKFRATLL